MRPAVAQRGLLAALALCAATSAAHAQERPGLGFGLLSLVDGQGLRLHALNLGNRWSTAASGCDVTLRFLDAKGAVLLDSSVRVARGEGAYLDLRRAQVSGAPARPQVRAALLFGYAGAAPPGPEARQTFDCNIVPTLEVFDDASGRTTTVLTDARVLPLPDPRASLGAP